MALRIAIAKRLYKNQVPSMMARLNFISPSCKTHMTEPAKSSAPSYGKYFNQLYNPTQINIRQNVMSGFDSIGLSTSDARKIMRCSQLQNVRLALKRMPMNSISYGEFVNVCCDACKNRDQGMEIAKVLDVAGDVIIFGNVVFLRPDQVAKSLEKLISQSLTILNDARKQELDKLERQKALIDQKAMSQVRSELYCGLGILVVQTLGFLRLTFWELSWDVMEPICFFVTSFHVVLAYMFFLRTSTEPTFEGYFQQRFRVKQRKLMDVHDFDYKKYNELCKAFHPDHPSKLSGVMEFHH